MVSSCCLSATMVFFFFCFFFFNDTATTEIYTLSLHDALPIYEPLDVDEPPGVLLSHDGGIEGRHGTRRSEEHTSELQSRRDLVCRLLLEKKKKKTFHIFNKKKKKKKQKK